MLKTLEGLARELRPLPLVATLLAVSLPILQLHAAFTPTLWLFFASLFFLLYATHCLDTYEDCFVRREDGFKTFQFAHGSSGFLSRKQLLGAATVSSLAFLAIVFWIAFSQDNIAFAAPILAAFLIGISYSRVLSRNALASLAAYPAAVVLAMASAYILAGGMDWGRFAGLAIPVSLLMLGTRVLMEAADAQTDARTGKPNVANGIGVKKTVFLSTALLLAGLAASLLFFFSPGRLLFSLSLAAVFLFASRKQPEKGVWLVAPGVFAFLVFEASVLHGSLSA